MRKTPSGSVEIWRQEATSATRKPAGRARPPPIPQAVKEAFLEALDPDSFRKVDGHIKNGGAVSVYIILT